jgi:acetyl-CoA carboxylase biotin carboxylase subunit
LGDWRSSYIVLFQLLLCCG